MYMHAVRRTYRKFGNIHYMKLLWEKFSCKKFPRVDILRKYFNIEILQHSICTLLWNRHSCGMCMCGEKDIYKQARAGVKSRRMFGESTILFLKIRYLYFCGTLRTNRLRYLILSARESPIITNILSLNIAHFRHHV